MDRKWWTLITVCTGTFMMLLDVTIVNVALPGIARDFGASLTDLQWVIDAYALALAALLLTMGSLADLIGRKRIYGTGIVIFVIGSTLCGSASSTTFLSVARGLQGIGGAMVFATGLALIAQAFPPKDRGVAFAAFGAVTGVSTAVGPVLGGVIIAGLSWRWIFFVNIPVGLTALTILITRVAESKLENAPPPDVRGFLTFSIGLAALVFGLIRSQKLGWGSTTVIVSFAVAVVLLCAWVFVEARAKHPGFNFALLRIPTFVGGLVSGFAVSASIFSLLAYLTIYLQDILGYSALQAGLRTLPLSGTSFFCAMAAGRLTTKVPIKVLLTFGFALLTVGLLLLTGLTAGDSWTHFLAGFVVCGAAAAFVNVPLASTAVGVVPAQRAGMATGANSTARQVGQATGVAALGTILTSTISSRVIAHLHGTPLAAHAHQIATSFSSSGAHHIKSLPASMQAVALHAVKASFADGLNRIVLIAAIVTFVAMLCVLALIRQRDFQTGHGPAPETGAGQ